MPIETDLFIKWKTIKEQGWLRMDKINMDYKLNFSNHLIKLLTKIDFLFMMQFPASTCIIYVAYLLFARITSYQDNSHSFLL